MLQLSILMTHPLLVPICFVTAWGTIILVLYYAWITLKDTVEQASRLHKIPCANCQFFTGEHSLKCTVHPTIATSEAAINCPDYQELKNPYTASPIRSHELEIS